MVNPIVIPAFVGMTKTEARWRGRRVVDTAHEPELRVCHSTKLFGARWSWSNGKDVRRCCAGRNWRVLALAPGRENTKSFCASLMSMKWIDGHGSGAALLTASFHGCANIWWKLDGLQSEICPEV